MVIFLWTLNDNSRPVPVVVVVLTFPVCRALFWLHVLSHLVQQQPYAISIIIIVHVLQMS